MINSILSKASTTGRSGGKSDRRESITKRYIYKDCDNFIREYDEELQPSISDQFKFISQHDKGKLYGGDECYLVSTEWLNHWVDCVKGAGVTVGPISNAALVEKNGYGSYRLKPRLKVKTDYRPVNKVVWEYYFAAFGGGPVIAFHVPTGFEPKYYRNGKWIENPDLKLDRLVTIVMPDATGVVQLSLSQPVDVTMLVTGTLSGLAAQNLVKDLGQMKMKEGLAMQAAVNEAQLISIGALLNTDSCVGKQMVAKATRILRMTVEDEEDGEEVNFVHVEATKQMLREGSALIIQHRWVVYKTRMLAKIVRADRDQLLKEGAIMRLQSAWRVRLAKRKYQFAKEKASELKSCLVLQRLMRSFIHLRRMRNIIRQLHPHNYVLTLKHGSNLNEGDSIVQDPYVVVTAYSIASRGKQLLKAAELNPGLQGARASRRGSVVQTKSHGAMNLLCYYRTAAPPGSTSPVWNEQTFVTGASWNSQLVLTYFDANKLGPDSCIGQNVIELKDYPQLYKGNAIEFDDFPVKNYTVPVRDPQETLLVAAGTKAKKGKGTVSFSLRLPCVTDSMCGWILRASSALMTSGQFKRRWMILLDNKLHCFEDPYTLNVNKGILDLSKVTSVLKMHTDAMTIHTKHESWLIKWDTSEAKNIQILWKRRFLKALPRHIAASIAE